MGNENILRTLETYLVLPNNLNISAILQCSQPVFIIVPITGVFSDMYTET